MHIVYFATRDEHGRLHQRIMRARWVDFRVEPDGPTLDMMPFNYVQYIVRPVEGVRIEPEPFEPHKEEATP